MAKVEENITVSGHKSIAGFYRVLRKKMKLYFIAFQTPNFVQEDLSAVDSLISRQNNSLISTEHYDYIVISNLM